MKGYLTVLAVLALGLLTCLLCGVSFAQEQEEEAAEETAYSWGTVSSVSSNQIVITTHDYDTGEDVDVAYIVSPDVEFYSVDTLEGITVGDKVWIDYVIRKNKNVAMGIELTKSSDEEELEY